MHSAFGSRLSFHTCVHSALPQVSVVTLAFRFWENRAALGMAVMDMQSERYIASNCDIFPVVGWIC